MKKTITSLILILLATFLFSSTSYAELSNDHWTLEADGYYYYDLDFSITSSNHNDYYGYPGIEYTLHDNDVITHHNDTAFYYNSQPIEYSVNHGSWQFV